MKYVSRPIAIDAYQWTLSLQSATVPTPGVVYPTPTPWIGGGLADRFNDAPNRPYVNSRTGRKVLNENDFIVCYTDQTFDVFTPIEFHLRFQLENSPA